MLKIIFCAMPYTVHLENGIKATCILSEWITDFPLLEQNSILHCFTEILHSQYLFVGKQAYASFILAGHGSEFRTDEALSQGKFSYWMNVSEGNSDKFCEIPLQMFARV